MAVGIKVYNADGSLQFDMTNRLLRVLSVDFSTTSSAGSTSVPSDQGSVVVAADPSLGDGKDAEFTVSGGTVSWTSGNARSGDILVF